MRRVLLLLALLSAAPACTYQPIVADAPENYGSAIPEPEPEDWESQLPAQIADVHAAVVEWRNFEHAKAAGWKAFGGDEPLMGQHYYNDAAPDYQYGDPLDFSRPNNLMYTRIDGRMVLTGVAFVVRIGAEEPLPAGFAGPRDEWHVHDLLTAINAATEDRPFVRSLAKWWLDGTYFKQGDYRHRLAMVHVWTEAPNPDGPFASYDRTLPYRKLGLPASYADGVSLDTARGVNLASDDACKHLIEGRAWIANFKRSQKRQLLKACEANAARVSNALDSDPASLNRVASIAWADYRAVYETVVSTEQRARIAAMTEHDHGHPQQH